MAITQEELAGRLKAARENAGLTQQEVAEEVGITRLAVVRIEAGKRAVNSLELAEMAHWKSLESPLRTTLSLKPVIQVEGLMELGVQPAVGRRVR